MKETAKKKFKAIIKDISTVISWTIFVILILCAIFLIYYYVATKVYATKGEGYEPEISLYTIISPSMVPNINVYDVVVDKKVNNPQDIKINDIITFNSDQFTGQTISVTHRVVEILVDANGNYSYSTKGDNNFVKDSYPTPYNKITGKVAFKIPQLGRIQFFLASKAGWLLIVVVPALYIILKDLLKIFKLSGLSKKFKNNKLFMPIRRKRLLLPLKGYTDEFGNKKKPTFKDLFPFTIDNSQQTEVPKVEIKKDKQSLTDIYDELERLEKEEDNKN